MAKPSAQKFRSSSHGQPRHAGLQAKTEQLIWGINPVLEALSACPQIIREIIADRDKAGRRLEQILDLAQKHAVPVTDSSEKIKVALGKSAELSGHENVQGVAARICLPILTLQDFLGKLKDIPSPPLLLALDSIQDPHNLGAIIRSAVAAGANGIILPKDRSASLTGTVIKVSAGSVFHVDICRVTNLASSLKILKENNIWVFGATMSASRPVYDVDLTVPACLVIGSEGKGLRPHVSAQCDLNISIPMQSSLDSLNASVAAGIILFEAVRQRRTQNR